MKKSKNLFESLKYAIEGIKTAFRHNRNLQIHTGIACIVIVLGISLKVYAWEFDILLLTILVVMSTEMINTVIEEMVDLITNEHKAQAKIAKDVGAGMVLIASIGAIIIGLIVFLPHITMLFH